MITDKQSAWIAEYERITRFEVLGKEELESGEATWDDFVKKNLRWFSGWAWETHQRLERDGQDGQ